MKSACLKLVQSLADCEGSPGCDEPGVEFDHCGETGKINQSMSVCQSVSQSINQSINIQARQSISIYSVVEIKYISTFS